MKISTAFLKGWVDPWREYLSEFLGCFIFVFLASSVLVSQTVFSEFNLFVVAVGIGLSYLCALYATAHSSGGFLNPAMVVALWLVKRLSAAKLFFYLFSQALGSVASLALVWGVFGERAVLARFGAPSAGLGVSLESVMLLEALLSALFVLLAFSISIAKTAPTIFGPLVLGLYTVIGAAIALPVSGASLNLARSLGPLLFVGDWQSLLIYTVGGISGSLVGVFYEFVFLKQSRK